MGGGALPRGEGMHFSRIVPVGLGLAVLAALPACRTVAVQGAPESKVTVARTPNEGIQPQAVTDAQGRLHLLYYKGSAAAGDLFYVRADRPGSAFAAPIRVNSQPGSAVAVGTIRGGQLALGKGGRIHVAWNGSNEALPKPALQGAPMLYARLNDAGTAFEPQQNLMLGTKFLDGGGTVAADANGHVWVAWQAAPPEGRNDGDRRLWIAHSSDEGKSFSPEAPAFDEPTGACPCCSVKAFADSKGTLRVLYRIAQKKTDRGMYLLSSPAASTAEGRFRGARLDRWDVDT
jgi:hypothetical protein